MLLSNHTLYPAVAGMPNQIHAKMNSNKAAEYD